MNFTLPPELIELRDRTRRFIAEEIIPMESDPRQGDHGPSDALRQALVERARSAGLLTPHASRELGGPGLSHVAKAIVFEEAGYSHLGPTALNIHAPDEGNIHLMEAVATPAQKARWLVPQVQGYTRSCFAMIEPAPGAGADPSMLATTAVRDGDDYVINGTKWFITGAEGATYAIVMARMEDGSATMFLTDMDRAGIRVVRLMDAMDRCFTGGHAVVEFKDVRIPAADVLGEVGKGFRYAQVRLAPVRLTHCMRWLGQARRAHDVALHYASQRQAFGKPLTEHENVGFMLADNDIDLHTARLHIWHTAWMLDRGKSGSFESSRAKVACSEAEWRVVDRCVQILGEQGVTGDAVVMRIFMDMRAFRIYDGPSEVHRWSMPRKLVSGGRAPMTTASQPAVDMQALAALMQSAGLAPTPDLRLEALSGGQSNPTYRVTGAGRPCVLRRKPLGALLPSAHAIDREYRVMKALAESDVPVPEMLFYSEDTSIVGTPFYLMAFLDGRVMLDQSLLGMTPADRHVTYAEMNRVIAALHRVDQGAVGLSDFGREGNYFGRQIARWTRQYRESCTEEIPAMTKLTAWLPAHIPEGDETTLVHGDFRLDNLVFHPTEPRVIGVLDWELSTLGHPPAYFSYHCMSWHIPPSLWRGIAGLDLAQLGIPSEAEYVRRYEENTGRAASVHWDFYLACNLFRMAAILQGIAMRARSGSAAANDAQETGRNAGPLADIGWGHARRHDAAHR